MQEVPQEPTLVPRVVNLSFAPEFAIRLIAVLAQAVSSASNLRELAMAVGLQLDRHAKPMEIVNPQWRDALALPLMSHPRHLFSNY